MSSPQLESPSRGFSFKLDAPLDMRFDPSQELTAADIVNTFSESELASTLETYGEEHRSRQIAKQIVISRPINTTLQLARIVEQAVGRNGRRIHPATKTFQALRITVNQELKHLEETLKQAVNLLGFGGRLVVISYHSLEDRLAKEFFHQESRGCICPPDIPICVCGHEARLKLVTKKVVTPQPSEIEANPRSRSAKLRAAERI
jgi:16S rRNA (cytosine1402-N4)-methyltransferase